MSASAGVPTSNTQKIIENYYYKGWNKADEKVIKQILDQNVQFRGVLGRKPVRGHDAFIKYMRWAHSTLTNNTCLIEDIIVSEQDGRAAVRVTCRGIHKGSFFGIEGQGHEVCWSNATFFTVKDGHITEIWGLGDIDTIKNQIGASQTALSGI